MVELLGPEPVIIEIHTSDRGTFKRCRRRFGWQSTIKENLVAMGPDKPAFFVGTGFHFAMEDFHGYKRFARPELAFAAYYDAQKPNDLPDEAEKMLDLAVGMIEYYVDEWLPQYPEKFETLWIDGVPQVEVEIAVDITDILFEYAAYLGREAELHEWLARYSADRHGPPNGEARVHYVITYDRVCIDGHERIAPLDYKTAASFDELNLQTNPQAGAYDWVADLFYSPLGYKPAGMLWQQHRKAVPSLPTVLKGGKRKGRLSLDKSQGTTYRLYKRALHELHGEVWPHEYDDMLATLANTQDERGDAYVRRELLKRNDRQREVEQDKIVAEVMEMLDPGLPMYPNPTKDCSWDCPFKAPCLAMDDGSDYQFMLKTEYAKWEGYKDDWRARVEYPADTSPTFEFKS